MKWYIVLNFIGPKDKSSILPCVEVPRFQWNSLMKQHAESLIIPPQAADLSEALASMGTVNIKFQKIIMRLPNNV